MHVPVTIYTEMTPNPATMKFVANKYLLISGNSAEFTTRKEAIGFSPLAEALFDFPFVKNVFITANFITITKTDNVPWDFITMELREFIKNWIANSKDILIQMPKSKIIETTNQENIKVEFNPSEFDDPIKALLDQYVRPAVENDGGAIDFLGFQDGKVSVLLKGSCVGCPSSTATLKGGIENLLKQHLPEVLEVVAING